MTKLLLILAIILSTNVYAVEFKGKFFQGHFIIGQTQPGSKIIIGKKEIKVSKKGGRYAISLGKTFNNYLRYGQSR